MHIRFRRNTPRRQKQDSRGAPQRTIRAHQHRADGLDSPPVDLAYLGESRKIMNKSAMDHSIASRGPALQAFKILQLAAMDLRSRGDEGLRTLVRPGKAENRMARVNEFWNNG